MAIYCSRRFGECLTRRTRTRTGNSLPRNGDKFLTAPEFRHQCTFLLLQIIFFFTEFCFREEVEDFFARMDRDFDGRLSFEEFMGEESPIEKLFKNMDKNGDGVVTKQVILIKGIR